MEKIQNIFASQWNNEYTQGSLHQYNFGSILNFYFHMFITAFSKPKKHMPKPQSKEVNEVLYEALQLNCHICASPYNSVDKIPTIICTQQHTYCLVCVNQLFAHRTNAQRCPSCRAYICKNTVYTNKTILRICDLMPQLANQFNTLSCEITSLKEERTKLSEALRKESQQGKQNIDNNVKVQDLQEHFPRLKELNSLNKNGKINIRGFLAKRRISGRKVEKKEQQPNKQYDARKKMKSIN